MVAMVAGIVGATFPSHAHAQQNVAAAEKEVRDTMSRYVAAYGSNDLDTYFRFFADDMTAWWGTRGRNDNPTPKAEYMNSWPGYVKKNGGYESCKFDDLRIQMSPGADAAVSSYELECIRRNPPAGQQPLITYEMTAVLFKRAADWKIVHFSFDVQQPPAPAASGR
jgi:ketosteroid isomerase-like protein